LVLILNFHVEFLPPFPQRHDLVTYIEANEVKKVKTVDAAPTRRSLSMHGESRNKTVANIKGRNLLITLGKKVEEGGVP